MESLKDLRVLVVEDEADCAELFNFIFEELAGARVLTVASAGDALAIQDRYQPDVLVSNLKLPDLNGYELVELVKDYEAARGREIIAVALTPSLREVNSARILGAGFQMHISKPINPNLLLAKLENFVGLEKVSQRRGLHRIQSTTHRHSYESRISDSAQSA